MNTPPANTPPLRVRIILPSSSPSSTSSSTVSPPYSPPDNRGEAEGMDNNDGRTWSQDGTYMQLAQGDLYMDISHKGEWHISSAKNVASMGEPACGIDELLDDSSDKFWQTEGSVPHWVSIEYNQKTAVSFIAIFLDLQSDESFTPKIIRVHMGEGEYSSNEPFEVYINLADRWRFIDLRPSDGRKFTKTWFIKMEIHENWQDGRDCRIRHMRIIAPRPSDLQEPVIPITEIPELCDDAPSSEDEDMPGPSSRMPERRIKKTTKHPFGDMPWMSGPSIR